jgi:hypothetical protein
MWGMKYAIGYHHISKVRFKMFQYNVAMKYDIGCHHISKVYRNILIRTLLI